MYVLESVGVELILESVKFSPRQVTKLGHACLGIVGSRVHTRVGGVSELVHACLGMDRGCVHTRVGEIFTEGGFKVTTCMFWK
jgi:hypothetical protein